MSVAGDAVRLCVICGTNPRKAGHRKCGPCAYRAEDREKYHERKVRGREKRRDYKRRLRRAAGCELMADKCARAAQRRAEAEARRAERIANGPEHKPWLAFPAGSAERFRSRYQNDPVFAQRERERAIVFRFTHPEIAVKSDRGVHWSLAAARSDGTVTKEVVLELLRARSCYICGVELTPDNRSIDHRVALTNGGGHTAGNLAPCCQACNHRKAWTTDRMRIVSTEMLEDSEEVA